MTTATIEEASADQAVQIDHSAMTSDECRTLWIKILTKIEPSINRGLFITWFRETMVLGREGGTLIVGLPVPMYLNWHLERYSAPTLEAAAEIDPTIEKVVYQVDGGLKDNPSRTINLLEHFPEVKKRKLPNKQEVKMAEGIISKILCPRYSMENFIVGSGNRLAHAACTSVAAQPGGKYNPLFLYGNVGLGKTHLLQATGNAILSQHPKAVVVYTTSEDFTNEVVAAIASRKMDSLRKRYRKVDVLIIDDIQFLAKKERTQEEFFHTFNTLYQDQKQVIISADRPPTELMLEDRLISRCERGMIADISDPDYETRLAILIEKAREYELMIEMPVLQFIAEHATRNVRELEGILMQAVAQYELEERVPTVSSINEIMQKLGKDAISAAEEKVGFETPPQKAVLMQDIMEAVSSFYSISIQEMIDTSRVREILVARQVAMYLAKKHVHMSYQNIGKAFSGRDHSTVLHACNKIEKMVNKDSDFLREVRAVEAELKR